MQDSIYYINGIWEKATKSTVPLNDTGFLLGDGLFETIRFENRKLFRSDKHLERLYASLNVIHIHLESTHKKIREIMDKIIQKNDLQSGLLRLMVTRGNVEGPPWKYTGPASIYINIRPLSSEPDLPVQVVFYPESKYPIIRYTPAIKSLNYMGNMLPNNGYSWDCKISYEWNSFMSGFGINEEYDIHGSLMREDPIVLYHLLIKKKDGLYYEENSNKPFTGICDDNEWIKVDTGIDLKKDLHAVWIDPDDGVWIAGGQVLAPPITNGVLIYRNPIGVANK